MWGCVRRRTVEPSGEVKMGLLYTRAGRGDFEEVAAALEKAAREAGLRVVRKRDLHVTLASKGFPIRPLRVYEVVLPQQSSGSQARLLPVTLSVFVKDDKIHVGVVRPTLSSRFFPEADVEDAARLAEALVVDVVDRATR